jgi:hypothetical protein
MTKVYIAGVIDATPMEAGQPPYPSQGPGFPTHPIAPGGGGGGGQPPGIWPSPGYPSHPIAPGGGPSQGPGFPTNPIYPGGPPPGIWPSPGQPAHPIYIPVDPPEGTEGLSPEHPIYIPVYPSHPIAPGDEASIREALKSFLQGNLPPHAGPQQR